MFKFVFVSLLIIGLVFANKSEPTKTEVLPNEIILAGVFECGTEICKDSQVNKD